MGTWRVHTEDTQTVEVSPATLGGDEPHGATDCVLFSAVCMEAPGHPEAGGEQEGMDSIPQNLSAATAGSQ